MWRWIWTLAGLFFLLKLPKPITSAELNLDCGVRPPEPQTNPWLFPKYGPYGWDNPNVARREDFPWQVAIFRKRNNESYFSYECGGTLIQGRRGKDDVLVLTGARCVTENENSTSALSQKENLSIVLGPASSNYNANTDEAGSQIFGVQRIEINPFYDAIKGHDSDVAILQLEGEANLGPLAFPACLPPGNVERFGVTYGMTGEVAGFSWDSRRNFTENLRYARYPVVMGKTCQEKLGVKVNDYLEFCTGNEIDSTACQGDYGGGLVFQQPKIQGRFFLQGILGRLDGTTLGPAGYCENYNVFKRIGPYLDWIKETQVKLESDNVARIPRPSPTPTGIPLSQVPDFAKAVRDMHNHYRAAYKVPFVRISGKLQREAQRLVEEYVSDGEIETPKDFPYSFNVYSVPQLMNAKEIAMEASQYWYRGSTTYDRNDPRPSAFTQMIWKSSTQIGVGVATNGKKTAVLVTYWPKGNVLYEAGKDYQRKKSYHDNVRVFPSHFKPK